MLDAPRPRTAVSTALLGSVFLLLLSASQSTVLAAEPAPEGDASRQRTPVSVSGATFDGVPYSVDGETVVDCGLQCSDVCPSEPPSEH